MGETVRKPGAVIAAVALVGGLTLVAASPAGAAAIVVGPGQSIQAAVDAAAPGSTIQVRPGTYFENVVITKAAIRLQGSGSRVTHLRPGPAPTGPCAFDPSFVPGICVLGNLDFSTFRVISSVRGVSVRGFDVSEFSGSGILVFGGQATVLEGNRTDRDAEYGIFAIASTGTQILDNTASGNEEAGFYVGDSPNANATVSGNRAVDNGQGVFIRSASNGTIANNVLQGNCSGMVFLNAPDTPTSWRVTGNQVNDNNRPCPNADPEEPIFSGVGIVVVGGRQITIQNNTVNGNRAAAPPGGGIILAFDASGDTVFGNTARANSPADIVNIGSGNTVVGNRCDISIPPGSC